MGIRDRVVTKKESPIQTAIDNDQDTEIWDTTVADGLDETEDSGESEYERKKRQIIMGSSDAKTKHRMLQNLSKELSPRK